MNPLQTPEEFCRAMWHEYLVERRYDMFDDLLDPAISVIGTGAHEVSRNIDEFAAAMERESAEWDGTFIIKDIWCQTTELSNNLYLVIGELMAKEDAQDGILYDAHFRFSVIMRREQAGWKVLHVHQSVPDPNQARDEFFPHRMVEQNGQQIIYNLRHDTMTGLLNRLYLKETVSRYMRDNPNGLLLMIDIDNFKDINDQYGHPVGDKVLILLSQSLKSAFPGAALGRVGGDEFVVYVAGVPHSQQLKTALDAFKQDWSGGRRIRAFSEEVTVSIGAARYPQDGTSYDDVWKKADDALYRAKKQGKNQIYIFD